MSNKTKRAKRNIHPNSRNGTNTSEAPVVDEITKHGPHPFFRVRIKSKDCNRNLVRKRRSKMAPKIFACSSANLYDIPSDPLRQALRHLQLNRVEEKNLCGVVVLHTRHHTRGHRELAWARVHSHLDNRGHMGPEDPSNKKRTMNKRYKRGALRSLGGQR